MNKRIAHFGSVVLAALAVSAGQAYAAEAPASQGDQVSRDAGDIVVTANRREESAQKVGIAITAVSGAAIIESGITNSTQIAKLAPGVTATGAQGGFLQTFSIRGVTQNDFQPHQEAPVAAYIDDVYISSLQGQAFAVFDPERVEILKGPQGTLFGRNATGGLVHYVSAKPKLGEVSGYADASYGRFNAVQLDGAVNVPLGDTVALRASGIFSHHDPILHNTIGPDQWDGRMAAGRVHLLIQPSDDFKELLSARYGRSSTTVSVANVFPSAIPVFNSLGQQIDELLAPGFDPNSLVTTDPLVGKPVTVSTSLGDTRSYSESYGFTSNTHAVAGAVSIDAIFDYSHFKWRVGSSLTNLFPFGFDTNAKGTDQFSGELRLSGDNGPLRWVVGGFAMSVKSNNQAAYGDVADIAFAGFGIPFPSDQVLTFHQHTHSYSAFAQLEYDLTDKLTAIGGIRYIKERKTYDYAVNFAATTTSPGALIASFNETTDPTLIPKRENLVSWKLGLNFKPRDGILLYATVNRGVKAGGFNAPSQPLPTSFYQFAPEVLMAYEGGFKTSLLDRKLFLNGSVFYYDYKSYQAFATLGDITYLFSAKARNVGAELQLAAAPADGLNMSVSASVMNPEVLDTTLGGVFKSVRRPAFAPKFQLSAQIRYETPVSVGKVWGQVDGNYSSTYYTQLSNFSSLTNKPYAIINARIGVGTASDKGWSLTAAVNNITNKRYQTSGFATAANYGADILAYSMPRTFEIGAHYKF